jgi:hypothetical protein
MSLTTTSVTPIMPENKGEWQQEDETLTQQGFEDPYDNFRE